MSSPIETELKLRIAPSAIAALRAHPRVEAAGVGPWRVARLDNRYHDTSDHALAAHGMALRLRRTSRGWMQTLKTSGATDGAPAALSSRGEWEMPVAGPVLSLERFADTPLAALGSPRALAKRLAPIFTTSFRRETRSLELRHGVTVELAIDTGVVTAGRGKAKRTTSICEVELEWKRDASAADDDAMRAKDARRAEAELLRFAAALARDIALLPLAESKAARGYRLLDDRRREPTKVRTPKLGADDDTRRSAVDVLDACAHAALDNLHALLDATHVDSTSVDAEAATRRLAALDTEFVHQARVAVRKLRSALRVFRPALGKRRVERIDAAWRDVGRVLGEVRDWDVLAESLPDIVERIGDADDGKAARDDAKHVAVDGALEHRAAEHRVVAERALSDALRSTAPGVAALTLGRELDALRRKSDSSASARVGRIARAWLDDQEDRVVSLARRIAVLDAPTRHRLRIEVKRLRYGIDFFEALFEADEYVDVLSELQDELGKLTDAVVQRERVPLLVDGDGLSEALSRYDRWLDHRLRKALPKIAALSVRFEMQGRPWQ